MVGWLRVLVTLRCWAAIVISLLKVQRYALYLYFFSLNFEMFNLFGLGSTSRLTGAIYLLAIIPSHRLFLKTTAIKPFLVPWFIFWFYLSVISFLNINGYSSKVFDITLLLNIFYFWFFLNHERRDPGVITVGFFCFALSGILLSLLYYAGIGIEYDGGRAKIFGDNQNAVAIRLSLAVIVLMYFSVTRTFFDDGRRWLLLIPVPLMLNFMLDTGSRKAIVAFVLAFLLGVLLVKTRKVWHKVFVFIASGYFAVYSIGIFLESEIIIKRFNEVVKDGGIANIDVVWANALSVISEHLIFGAGLSGYARQTIRNIGFYMSPHNVLLEVLAYTGIVGFSMYLYFLSKVGVAAYLGYKSNHFLLPLLLLIPVLALILGGQALTTKIVWCIFAFAISSQVFRPRMMANGKVLRDL